MDHAAFGRRGLSGPRFAGACGSQRRATSSIDHSRALIPAAIAGAILRVLRTRAKLYQNAQSATNARLVFELLAEGVGKPGKPPHRGTTNPPSNLTLPGGAAYITRPDNLPIRVAAAGWQSGYATDCKSVYSGSIPLPASISRSHY